MGWVAPVLMGLSGLAGLFGSKNKQQTSGTQNTTQSGTQTQGFSGASSSNPLLNPLATQGYGQIAKNYMDLLTKDPDLSGYMAGQSGNINNLANIQRTNVTENLASRGISGPAVGTALGGVESQRIGGITSLSQQIPLLARQLQEQTLQNAGGFFRGIPTGTYNEQYGGGTTTSSGTSSTQQQGTTTNSQNPLSSMFGGLGNILALLYGMGGLGGGKTENLSY